MSKFSRKLKNKFISLRSKARAIYNRYGDSDRVFDSETYRDTTIMTKLKSLERIATIEGKRYLNARDEENYKLIAEYLELVREYRDLMTGFLSYVDKPETITDDTYRPQYIINRFLYAIEKYQTTDNPEIKQDYSDLVDLLSEWSQKIILNKRLDLSDIQNVMEISLTESVDIYTYSERFPEIFNASKLPAEVFTETISFIAFAYAVLNKVDFPENADAPTYIKNYAQAYDSNAFKGMIKWLTKQVSQHYIPLSVLHPEDLLMLDPKKMWLIVEYSDIVNYNNKMTNFQTVEEFDVVHDWNRFLSVIDELKNRYDQTSDMTDVFKSIYNDKWLGQNVSNILIGVGTRPKR